MSSRLFSEYVPGRLCGRMRQMPLYDVESRPIYDALRRTEPSLTREDREALIVKRANWVTQVKLRVPLYGINWDSYEISLYTAQCVTRQHLRAPRAPEFMPHEEALRARFRHTGAPQGDARVETQREHFRTAEVSQGLMPANKLQQSHDNFRASEICPVMLDALAHIVQTCRVGRITKIVAIGSNGFFHWNESLVDDASLRAACNEQICEDRRQLWMSLVTMRDFLQEQGTATRNCGVLVQDTSLRETETMHMRQVGITPLCGAYGHQQGFAEIDGGTLLVLLRNHRELLGLIQEIADPAIVYLNEPVATRAPLPSDNYERADGYRLTVGWPRDQEGLDIPSGQIKPDFLRFHRSYVEVPVDQFDQNKPKLGRTPIGRRASFFVHKNPARGRARGRSVRGRRS